MAHKAASFRGPRISYPLFASALVAPFLLPPWAPAAKPASHSQQDEKPCSSSWSVNMPYYLGAGEPAWDYYMNMLRNSDGDTEPPMSLFKYVEPWSAKATVLHFPDTPGPQPEAPISEQTSAELSFERFESEQKFASDLALWNISRMTFKCRTRGVKRVFGSYDGGGDESFTYFRSIEMSDGRVISAGSMRAKIIRIDCEQLIADAASALMGYFSAGEFVLHGAVVIDFEACTITDERNVDVVFGR
jgi:hypothetical protein